MVKSFPKKPTKKKAEKKADKPKKATKGAVKKSAKGMMSKHAKSLDKLTDEPKKRGRPRKPRAMPLPGMEDSGIQELDDIAEAYAEIRDERIALNQSEHELKNTALVLMHKYGKTIYRHNGLEILVTAGAEDVKVKVKKQKDEEEDRPEDAHESFEVDPGPPASAGEGESPSADDDPPF